MPFAAHDLHLIVALPKRPAPLRKKYAPNRNQPKHSSCFIDDKIRLLLSGDSQPPAQRRDVTCKTVIRNLNEWHNWISRESTSLHPSSSSC